MKKLVIIFFAVNILSAQKTRAEILEMAVTLNWTIDSASSNQIKLFMNEEEYEQLKRQKLAEAPIGGIWE